MPSFIQNNVIIEVGPFGIETTRRVLFTDREVIDRIKENSSLVFEVTESHAAQVMRPQQKYQEVNPHILQLIAEENEAALLPPLTPAQQKKLDASNKKHAAMLNAEPKVTDEQKAIDRARDVVEGVDPLDPTPIGTFGG